jgi:sortase A
MRRWLSKALLLAGSAILVWCASVWASTALFEKYEYWRWNTRYPEASRALAAPVNETRLVVANVKPKPHDVIAWLDVPRLHISTAVLEGDDDLSLGLGAGHIPGTPMPGALGNVGIAAHRDSFFRPLGGIERQDHIRLRTPEGDWEYTVESTRIVRPSNVSVLANSGQPELTLITCYPFRYVGAAPLRFVVRARRTG